MPTSSINIHASPARPLRLIRFMPNNNALLVFTCGDAELKQWGLPMEKAWALFDLWADDETLVYAREAGGVLSTAPEFADRLAALRAETLSGPALEVAA